LDKFCDDRKKNFIKYNAIFGDFSEYFILPQATDKSDPAWFSYIISIKEDAPFSRDDIVLYFNENLIETRNLFAGNMVRQPAFIDKTFRIADHLENTDFIMNNTFFLGTYPGNGEQKLEYIKHILNNFMKEYCGNN